MSEKEKDVCSAADTVTQEWWKHTNPCQELLLARKEGEWWAIMEEVFHCD
jgi:L-rhamnose mutarotase